MIQHIKKKARRFTVRIYRGKDNNGYGEKKINRSL